MFDVGRELAQARERRALSIHDLARRTKITVPILEAIEGNRLSELPGGFYARALLRTYAREVGCDPEAIVSGFRSAMPERNATETLEQIAATVDRSRDHRLDAIDRDMRPDVRRRRLLVVGLIIIFSGSLYLTLGARRNAELLATTTQPVQVAATTRPLSPAPAPAPAPTPAVRPTAGIATPRLAHADTAALHLTIKTMGECWVSATADGAQVIYRMLDAGEQASIDGDDVVLRVGDPSTFTFTVNGAAARLPGEPGTPATLHLTKQNVREFLARQDAVAE